MSCATNKTKTHRLVQKSVNQLVKCMLNYSELMAEC